MAYEPRSYWPERAKKFGRIYASGHDPRPHTWTDQAAIFRALRDFQPERILDAGCGDGRMFPFLLEAREVVACDPCEEMLAHARKTGYVETHGYELVKIDRYDGTLPFEDSEFDLAISVSVLLHVLPADIEFAISELVRVARRVLVITYYENREQALAEHNFKHDYPKIFSALGLDVSDYGADGQRRRWVISRPEAQDNLIEEKYSEPVEEISDEDADEEG